MEKAQLINSLKWQPWTLLVGYVLIYRFIIHLGQNTSQKYVLSDGKTEKSNLEQLGGSFLQSHSNCTHKDVIDHFALF